LTTDADGLRYRRTGPFIQLELLSPRAPRVRGSRLSSTVRRSEASRRRGASVRLRVSRLRPGLRSGLEVVGRSDVSLDMSVATSLAWHVSRRLQRLGETDRSTGLTPGRGNSWHVPCC
jgi:hypothetical protein